MPNKLPVLKTKMFQSCLSQVKTKKNCYAFFFVLKVVGTKIIKKKQNNSKCKKILTQKQLKK